MSNYFDLLFSVSYSIVIALRQLIFMCPKPFISEIGGWWWWRERNVPHHVKGGDMSGSRADAHCRSLPHCLPTIIRGCGVACSTNQPVDTRQYVCQPAGSCCLSQPTCQLSGCSRHLETLTRKYKLSQLYDTIGLLIFTARCYAA